jgi:hypothetical protein
MQNGEKSETRIRKSSHLTTNGDVAHCQYKRENARKNEHAKKMHVAIFRPIRVCEIVREIPATPAVSAQLPNV